MADGLDELLWPGEEVVWEGRSVRGVTFTGYDAPLVAVGALGAIVGFGFVLQGQVLIGLPLLIVGAYLGGGYLLVEAWRRRHTRYVLTTDHAFLVRERPVRRIATVDLRRCGPSTIRHHHEGSGTITFGPFPLALRWIGPLRWRRPTFRFIQGADLLLPVIRGDAASVQIGDGETGLADPGAG